MNESIIIESMSKSFYELNQQIHNDWIKIILKIQEIKKAFIFLITGL